MRHLESSPADTRYCGMTADHMMALTGAVWDFMGRQLFGLLRVSRSVWFYRKSTSEILLSSLERKAIVEKLPGFHAMRRMGAAGEFWWTIEY